MRYIVCALMLFVVAMNLSAQGEVACSDKDICVASIIAGRKKNLSDGQINSALQKYVSDILYCSTGKRYKVLLKVRDGENGINSDDNFYYCISKNRITIEVASSENIVNAIGLFLKDFCGMKFFVPSEIGYEIPQNYPRLKKGVHTISPSFKGRKIGHPPKTFASLTGGCPSYIGSNHYLSRLVDANVTKENPEFLAEVGGVREKWSPSAMLDFRSGGLRQFIKNHSHEYFKKNPTAKVYSLSYADSTAFADDTQTLMFKRGLTPNGYADFSNLVFSFSNDIARYFKKAHPNKLISTLAYINSENPPSIPLEDNIVVYLCGDRGNYFDQDARKRDIDLMKAWCKRGVKHFGIYDYNYGKDYFIPRNITHHIVDGLKNAYTQGARYYYCEMYPNWAYDACKYWVLSNLLIDINADPIKLENEFYKEFYKESALPIRQFFDIAREQWDSRKDVPMWLTLYKRDGQAKVFSANSLSEMESALQSAERLAQMPVVKARVNELRLMFDITKAYIHTYNLQKKLWGIAPTLKDFAVEVADITQAIDISKRTLNVCLERYKNNTRYPLVNFSEWNKLDYMDASRMRLQQVENLNFSGSTDVLSFVDKSPMGETNISKWTFKNSPNVHCNVEKGKAFVKMSSWLPAYFYRSFVVPQNKEYRFSMDVSGNLDLGAIFYIELSFFDKDKNIISQTRQRLPNLKNFPSMPIFVQAKAPENTATANIAMFTISMRPTDFVEIKNVKFLMK